MRINAIDDGPEEYKTIHGKTELQSEGTTVIFEDADDVEVYSAPLGTPGPRRVLELSAAWQRLDTQVTEVLVSRPIKRFTSWGDSMGGRWEPDEYRSQALAKEMDRAILVRFNNPAAAGHLTEVYLAQAMLEPGSPPRAITALFNDESYFMVDEEGN